MIKNTVMPTAFGIAFFGVICAIFIYVFLILPLKKEKERDKMASGVYSVSYERPLTGEKFERTDSLVVGDRVVRFTLRFDGENIYYELKKY